MKTLYLLRHAKSGWPDSSVGDFERPLSARGEKTAPFVGALMKENGLLPQTIISSPAKRARETAELVAETLEFADDIIFDQRVYEASPMRLIAIVSEIGNELDSAMIVGHNPGMEGIIWYLTGKMEPMPTAALAQIQLPVDRWNEITEGCGTLTEILRPKDVARISPI
ncbi:MAG: histidine phosphatase family protein [Acidobacteriota bacterium]